MELILWRHADAMPLKNEHQADDQRKLSSKGRKQAARVAAWLERHLPDSTRVLASPSLRARETAEALGRKIQVVDALATGATAAQLLIEADWPDCRGAVVIVGHQPALGRAASLLLCGAEQDLSIRKGGLWWITNHSRGDDEPQHSRLTLRAAICPEYL